MIPGVVVIGQWYGVNVPEGRLVLGWTTARLSPCSGLTPLLNQIERIVMALVVDACGAVSRDRIQCAEKR